MPKKRIQPAETNRTKLNFDDLLEWLNNIPRTNGVLPGTGFTGGNTRGINTPIDLLGAYPYKDSSNGLRFADVLAALQSGNTDASQLLATLIKSGNREFSDERWDMLYQYLLQLSSTADQRAYDYTMLQESRQYNDPTNTLARFMGAGISRDAAIQLLSSGGAGVGSAMGSGSGVSAPAVSAPSGSMELQRQNAFRDTIFGVVNCICSLMDSGMTLAQGVEQTKALQAQNYWSQEQIQSYQSVNQVTQALQSLQTAGALDPAEIEKLSNADDLVKYLGSLSESNPDIANLIKTPAYSRSLGTTLGREMFNRHWSAMRDSRNQGDILDEYLRGVRANNAIAELQPSKIAAEMEQIGQNMKESEQRIIESCNRIAIGEAQIFVLNEQGKYQQVQTRKASKEIDYLQAQIEGQDIANQQAALDFEYNSAGFPMLKQSRIDELSMEALKWNTLLRDKRYGDAYVKEMQRKWLTEANNATEAAYITNLYLNAVGDFALSHPSLYQLGALFKDAGMSELLKVGANVGTSIAIGSKFIP